MPDLELESVIAAGIGMHRSVHSRQVTVDQHMIKLTRFRKNDKLLTYLNANKRCQVEEEGLGWLPTQLCCWNQGQGNSCPC